MNIQLKLCQDHLSSLERRVKQLLEKFKDKKPKWVFFSGGKDSLVALDLATKYWSDFTVIYCEVTGNTHPECTKYSKRLLENYYGVDYIIVKTDKYDFYQCLKRWGYPSFLWRNSRWCLMHFKDEPIIEVTDGKGFGISGVSPKDSTFRASKVKNPVIYSGKGYRWCLVSVLPIYYFNKNDIWLYIYENGLPINPLYKRIGFSGNCVICPAINFKQFLAVKHFCPEFFSKWKEAHELLRKHGKKGMKVVFHKFDKWYSFVLNTPSYKQ